MEIKFHGHSCFELSEGETRVLVDPFLKPNNPSAVASAEDVDADPHRHLPRPRRPHGRRGSASPTRTGAECVAIVEIANWLEEQGVEKVYDPNLGGTVRFDWGWVKLVPAWHTSTIAGLGRGALQPDLRHGRRHRCGPADQPRRRRPSTTPATPASSAT